MPHRKEKLLLDLRISCEEILEFSKAKSFDEFIRDRLLQLGLEREFEIIGEALWRLSRIDPENIETKIPDFRKIIGFRNILAHGYDIIDQESLWDFVQNRVPELLEMIQSY
jgi:uncharacterized protein with HEPN domain